MRRVTRSSGRNGIGRHADCVFYIRKMRGDPIQPGENAGERTKEALHVIGDDWKTELAQSCGIAIGVQHKAFAL